MLALNDGIKVWIECLLRYTEHWPIVYIPYIVKVSGCLFFVWYENLIAQFVGINSPKTDIGFMILCDLGA